MNGELLAVFEYLEKEKGISRDVLIEAVASSLLTAARKKFGELENLKVEIDKETGDIKAYSELRVVENVQLPEEEISLGAARELDAKAEIGGLARRYVPAKSLGRIAAQTAKQVIIQRIKEAENEIVYNDYKDRVGDIIAAVVRRYERGNVILDLGRAEAILPPKEQCPREGYGVGRRFKVYIVSVEESVKGPEIIVSRNHAELLRKIFELEVPEISEGFVEIKDVARDPGFRSKIAVTSTDEKVDAVGACVGMRGARVKNVVRELNGENVDIVRWSDNKETYVTSALSPATPRKVTMVDDRSAVVIIDDDQFSLAVGRKGHGARLISRLTGMRITVKKQSEIEREEREASISVDQIPGIAGNMLSILLGAGYKTLGDIRVLTLDDLMKIPGVGEKTAEKIAQCAADFTYEEEKKEPQEPAVAPGETAEAAAETAVVEPAGESADNQPGETAGSAGEGETGPPAGEVPGEGAEPAAEEPAGESGEGTPEVAEGAEGVKADEEIPETVEDGEGTQKTAEVADEVVETVEPSGEPAEASGEEAPGPEFTKS